jgi:cell division septation protein DedD
MYSRNHDLDEDDERGGRDREIALGTSFIVGIFFALVLICAIFFAFGYSLGRRSALPASGTPDPVTGASASAPGLSKPASGIPQAQAASSSSSIDEETSDEQPSPAAKETPVVLPAKLAIRSTPVSKPAMPSVSTPGVGQSVVQVAAVSRQGDADMLMTALKRRGYSAAVHQTPQDKLLHVQIGPFATKKDAEAMRQKLLADGYNAIVK